MFKALFLSLALFSTTTPEVTLLDIPLPLEVNQFIYDESEFRQIPYELIIAVIDAESTFQLDVVSETGDYGLMQINQCNIASLKEEFQFDDIMYYRNNVRSGVYLLSELYTKYDGDVDKTLMAYNMGDTGAKQLWKKGITESKYSIKIKEKYEINLRTTKASGR